MGKLKRVLSLSARMGVGAAASILVGGADGGGFIAATVGGDAWSELGNLFDSSSIDDVSAGDGDSTPDEISAQSPSERQPGDQPEPKKEGDGALITLGGAFVVGVGANIASKPAEQPLQKYLERRALVRRLSEARNALDSGAASPDAYQRAKQAVLAVCTDTTQSVRSRKRFVRRLKSKGLITSSDLEMALRKIDQNL